MDTDGHRWGTALAGLVVAVVLVGVPEAAWATDVRLGAGVGWMRETAFDAFRQDDLLSRLDACVSYTVLAAPPLRLDVEVGYGYAGSLGAPDTFAALDTELTVHDFYAGVRASIAVADAEWVRPYVRVQGGATLGLASFQDMSALEGGRYEASDVGGLVYGGGGVEFVLPMTALLDDAPEVLSEPLAFGIYVEGGYFYRTALSFSPSVPGPDDEAAAADRIPVAGFSAGDVGLSGGELRVGFVARM